MVKDHSDSEKGNPLPPQRLLLSFNSNGALYAPSHRQDNTYHGLCYTSRGALAGTRNSSNSPIANANATITTTTTTDNNVLNASLNE